jgi:hypothetical protein
MQQPNQRELDVSTLTVAARTVVLEGSSIDGPEPPGVFDAAINALAHWKGAALAGVSILVLAWVGTDGMRSSAKAEFLLQAPVDEFSQLTSAADAARAIEFAPVPSKNGASRVAISVKPDKTSDLVAITMALTPAADARAEAERVIEELNADLAGVFDQATRAIDSRIESIDSSIAEARAILEHPEKLPAQSDAIGLVMAEIVKLREERGKFLRRRGAASGFRLVGEVRVTEPKLLSTGTLAPPLAAAAAFVVTAFTLHGFAQARARRAAAAAGAGARN